MLSTLVVEGDDILGRARHVGDDEADCADRVRRDAIREGKGPLNTAEWWVGPNRALFTVPIEGYDRCEFWVLQRICRDFGFPPESLEEDP
jgi:hypothetical protein